MEPTLLALDTATDSLAIALLTPGRAVHRLMPGGAEASARLLPAVLALLAESGLAAGALDAVAFGRGPGAFTGLRTACAVAQGLAFGIGKPVLPLDSLLLVAEDARLQANDPAATRLQWVAMDARMDEVYAGAYAFAQGRWLVRVAPALYTLPALAAQWVSEPPPHVAGSALAAFGDRLPLGAASRQVAEQDRAAALGRLARQAWADGAAIDPAQALPLYLRDKVALTTAERVAERTRQQATRSA